MTIPIKQKITTEHRVNLIDWQDVSKAAWEEAGKVWHQEILPKHFEPGAVQEYRYAPRSKDSDDRKFDAVGHRRPMVLTGLMRAQVLGQSTIVSRKVKRKGSVKIKVSGPRYLKRGRLWFELRAVSREDDAIIAKVLDRVITEEMNKDGKKKQAGT